MDESVALVREHLPLSVDEFVEMGLVKDGIYKRLEYAIENVFDICAILNADLSLGVPGTDEDILAHLVQAGVLGRGMREKLKAMKGFRNIVVHRYGAIDDRLAFGILCDHINDFSGFKRDIEKYLSSHGGQE